MRKRCGEESRRPVGMLGAKGGVRLLAVVATCVGALLATTAQAFATSPFDVSVPVCATVPASTLPTPESGRGADLVFGIYPGGVAGFYGLPGAPPDDPVQIDAALDALQPAHRLFLVRGWVAKLINDPAVDPRGTDDYMNLRQYAHDGRKLNVVIAYTAQGYNGLDDWLAYVRHIVRAYGPYVDSLSVTSEANLTSYPGAPGTIPGTREALVDGVIAAKREARRLGYSRLRVGFDVIVSPVVADEAGFWASLLQLGGAEFAHSVDYVGAVLYADVFGPAAPDGQPGDIRHVLVNSLDQLRNCSMPQAGLGARIPIQVVENGWPTTAARSEARQAQVIADNVQTIRDYRANFNIRSYILFALRDYLTASSDPQYGIMRDDYSKKPAFDAYRTAIRDTRCAHTSACEGGS